MPDSPILKRNIKLGFTSIEDIANLHPGGKNSNLRASGHLMQKNGEQAGSKVANKSPLKNNSYYKPDQMSSSYMRHGQSGSELLKYGNPKSESTLHVQTFSGR